jgi:hypothetical protein
MAGLARGRPADCNDQSEREPTEARLSAAPS